ncbi:RlpA-like double-psi beta-barrel domain-containing protein [Egibacter rhizosphaerae]|uniref:RlpA-like double-psi beta-barrel domain-containing protein n=1 Tax=Egibacter rhizosphaerae TaxID=1670831 RepID=UPI0013F1540A|nr:RlpA-like double-psi beta-barrel domain-containing protein [Egibacter rhizosphaerae]
MLLGITLALALAACSSEAEPTAAPERAGPPTPPVDLSASGPASSAAGSPGTGSDAIDREAERAGPAIPDLTGAPVEAALAEVRAAGLTPQVVALEPDDPDDPDDGGPSPSMVADEVVTGQQPGPGDQVGGTVTLWIGDPPAPPPPPQNPEPTAPAADPDSTGGAPDADAPDDSGEADGSPDSDGTPDDSHEPNAGGDDPAAAAPEHTPSAEAATDDDAPGRVNIRTIDPPEPGTELSGPASWYGPGFAGRGDACGSRFDPDELTIATRELRCGTIVEVAGPAGTIEATVTDWGPAEWTGRRFDLSRATFARVASLGAGEAPVTLTVVD